MVFSALSLIVTFITQVGQTQLYWTSMVSGGWNNDACNTCYFFLQCLTVVIELAGLWVGRAYDMHCNKTFNSVKALWKVTVYYWSVKRSSNKGLYNLAAPLSWAICQHFTTLRPYFVLSHDLFPIPWMDHCTNCRSCEIWKSRDSKPRRIHWGDTFLFGGCVTPRLCSLLGVRFSQVRRKRGSWTTEKEV